MVHFADHPEFEPNLTPRQILEMGAFGGTYFRPIRSGVLGGVVIPDGREGLPPSWFRGIDVAKKVVSETYDPRVNRYKVRCGSSLEDWEKAGWIRGQDPYGWFQWYCRFYAGRRTADDARQIARANGIMGSKGRFRVRIYRMVRKREDEEGGKLVDDPTVSPVIRQTLLHWGYVLNAEDYEKMDSR
jgi:hypothetical protein